MTETYTPSDLIANAKDLVTKEVTVKTGNDISKGCVLGRILRSIGSGSANDGNTGDGALTVSAMGKLTKIGTYALDCVTAPGDTLEVGSGSADTGNTGDGALTVSGKGANVKKGTYTLTCVAAATDAGTFSVVDPDGNRLDDAEVGTEYDNTHLNFTIADGSSDFAEGDFFTIDVTETGDEGGTFAVTDPDGNRLEDATIGTEYSNDHLTFTVAHGTTDFVVGDGFTITVSEDSDKKTEPVDDTRVDGVEDPYAVLAEDVDASSGDVVSTAYIRGQFNEDELSFGGDDDADDHREALEARGIILRSPTSR